MPAITLPQINIPDPTGSAGITVTTSGYSAANIGLELGYQKRLLGYWPLDLGADSFEHFLILETSHAGIDAIRISAMEMRIKLMEFNIKALGVKNASVPWEDGFVEGLCRSALETAEESWRVGLGIPQGVVRWAAPLRTSVAERLFEFNMFAIWFRSGPNETKCKIGVTATRIA
jgi:hypothetical protein